MQRILAFTRTLRFRIFAITALCWLLPMLVLGGYLGGVFFSALREKTESELLISATHAESNAVIELDRLIKLSKAATYDNVFEDGLAEYRYGNLKYQDYYRNCRIYLDAKYFRERAFSFAMFYLIDDPDQYIATTGSNAFVREFIASARPIWDEIGAEMDTKCRFICANGHTYLVRNLYNRKLQRFGVLVMGVEPKNILKALIEGSDAWKDSIDVRLDDYQLIQSGSPAFGAGLEPGLSERGGELILSREVKTRDYTLSYQAHIDRGRVYGQIDQFNRLMLGMLLLLLPIEALILLLVQRRLTRPLNLLAMASSRGERGELGVTVDIDTHDEVGQLARSYNAMSLQIQHLIEKSFEEELILRDARIEALQSRINPHFLNNTLEMINWQARIEGSEAISGMIEAMSTLLNAGLDRERAHTVPLSQELQVADAYFFFLNHRFGEKLTVERDIDQNLLNAPVPRLAIQTLLENAVEHGIAPAGGGRIKLSVHEDGGMLHIGVVNNGRPLSPEDRLRIEALLEDDGGDATGKLKGRLGIRNINRRAKLLYGDEARLTLTPGKNGETLARLSLPYRQNASHSDE